MAPKRAAPGVMAWPSGGGWHVYCPVLSWSKHTVATPPTRYSRTFSVPSGRLTMVSRRKASGGRRYTSTE
jgi:hypothetical protein